MAIDIFCADEQEDHQVEVAHFGELARRVLEAQSLKGDVEVSLLFVDAPSMAELNLRFLGEPGPTDVLAFPIEDEPELPGRSPDEGGTGPGGPTEPPDIPLLLGDIVICPVVASSNAEQRGASFEAEMELLVVHGILHLLGMDHEEEDEAKLMEVRQTNLLKRFGSAGTSISSGSLTASHKSHTSRLSADSDDGDDSDDGEDSDDSNDSDEADETDETDDSDTDSETDESDG